MDQSVVEVPQVTQEMLAAKAKLKAKRQANCIRQAKRKSYRKGSGAQPTSSVMNSNVTQAEQRHRLLNRKRNCRRWAKRQAANETTKAEAQSAAVPSPKRPAPQTRRAGSKRIQVESANAEMSNIVNYGAQQRRSTSPKVVVINN